MPAVPMSKNGSPRVNLSAQNTAKGALGSARKPERGKLAEFVEKVEADYQFNLGRLTILSLIQSANVSIEVEGGARAAALADNLTAAWEASIESAFTCFGYGRAAHEITFGFDRANQLFTVSELTFLPYRRTKPVFDGAGELAAIDIDFISPGEQRRYLRIPAEEIWWAALGATPETPSGTSRYLGAPWRVWLERRDLFEQEQIWLRRFALGQYKARAPVSDPDSTGVWNTGDLGELDAQGQPVDHLRDMEREIAKLGSGGSLTLPASRDESGNFLWDYDATSINPDNTALENRRKALDVAVLRSLGIPERAITQDESTGSFALARAHLEVLRSTVAGVVNPIAKSFQRDVIDRAVALNFGGDGTALTITVDIPDGDAVSLILELVKSITTTAPVPPLVAEGVLDIVKLLEIAGLPVGDDLPAKLETIRRQASQAAAGPLGLGSLSSRISGRRLQSGPDLTPLPSGLDNWEHIAARASDRAREIFAEIEDAAPAQGSIDRGRL
jgi:hypothetical protein